MVRYTDDEGRFYGDGILLKDELDVDTIYHPYYPAKHTTIRDYNSESLHQEVLKDGKLTIDIPTPQQSAAYAKSRLEKLNPEHKRFENPHIYKVGISKKLMDLRDRLTQSLKRKN